MTVMGRIEALERKLSDCEQRLQSEEKRRKILETWILQNFNFDIQFELDRQVQSSAPARGRPSNTKPKRERKENLQFASSRVGPVVHPPDVNCDSDPNYSPPNSPRNFDDHSSPSTKRVKKSPSTRSEEGSGSNVGKPNIGRRKEAIWKYFRTSIEPRTDSDSSANSKPVTSVYCKSCNQKVSPKAERLKLHHMKCAGQSASASMDEQKSRTEFDAPDKNPEPLFVPVNSLESQGPSQSSCVQYQNQEVCHQNSANPNFEAPVIIDALGHYVQHQGTGGGGDQMQFIIPG